MTVGADVVCEFDIRSWILEYLNRHYVCFLLLFTNTAVLGTYKSTLSVCPLNFVLIKIKYGKTPLGISF